MWRFDHLPENPLAVRCTSLAHSANAMGHRWIVPIQASRASAAGRTQQALQARPTLGLEPNSPSQLRLIALLSWSWSTQKPEKPLLPPPCCLLPKKSQHTKGDKYQRPPPQPPTLHQLWFKQSKHLKQRIIIRGPSIPQRTDNRYPSIPRAAYKSITSVGFFSSPATASSIHNIEVEIVQSFDMFQVRVQSFSISPPDLIPR